MKTQARIIIKKRTLSLVLVSLALTIPPCWAQVSVAPLSPEQATQKVQDLEKTVADHLATCGSLFSKYQELQKTFAEQKTTATRSSELSQKTYEDKFADLKQQLDKALADLKIAQEALAKEKATTLNAQSELTTSKINAESNALLTSEKNVLSDKIAAYEADQKRLVEEKKKLEEEKTKLEAEKDSEKKNCADKTSELEKKLAETQKALDESLAKLKAETKPAAATAKPAEEPKKKKLATLALPSEGTEAEKQKADAAVKQHEALLKAAKDLGTAMQDLATPTLTEAEIKVLATDLNTKIKNLNTAIAVTNNFASDAIKKLIKDEKLNEKLKEASAQLSTKSLKQENTTKAQELVAAAEKSFATIKEQDDKEIEADFKKLKDRAAQISKDAKDKKISSVEPIVETAGKDLKVAEAHLTDKVRDMINHPRVKMKSATTFLDSAEKKLKEAPAPKKS